MPFPLIPVITAAAGLGSSLINHFSARSLSNNAFRQNVNMWNMQNQYNSPAAQVARLTAAGLNPALAYGGSSQVVGNSDTPPQLDYQGTYNQPLIQPGLAMEAQQALSMEYQRNLTNSQIEKNAAETIESLNRGRLSGAEVDYAKEYAVEKLNSMRLLNDKTYQDCLKVQEEIPSIIASRDLTFEQRKSLEYANEFNRRTMETRIEATQLQNFETKKRFREIDAIVSKYQAETGLIYKNIEQASITNSYLPQTLQSNLNVAQQNIESMKKNMEVADENIRNIAVKTGISEYELQNYFYINAPGIGKVVSAPFGSMSDKRNNRVQTNYYQQKYSK